MEHPRSKGKYEDRRIDCQLALEPAIQQAIDDAVAVGWRRDEIIDALAGLVINFAADDSGGMLTEFSIADARFKHRH